MAIRRAFPLLLLPLLVVVACDVRNNGDDEATPTAEEIAAEIETQKQELLDALSDGGVLLVTVEDYRRDRLNPEGLIPPSMRLPDRTVTRTSLDVDEMGRFVGQRGETLDEDGTLLQVSRLEDGKWIGEHPDTGESYEMPAPVITGDVRVEDWLDYAFEPPFDPAEEPKWGSAGSGTLEGRESLIFERRSSVGGEDMRREFEFARASPIVSRQTDYRILPDGSEQLVSEIILRSIEAVPD